MKIDTRKNRKSKQPYILLKKPNLLSKIFQKYPPIPHDFTHEFILILEYQTFKKEI